MTSVLEAIALIDAVLGPPTAEQARDEKERKELANLHSLGILPHKMGGIATKGCGKCGGTMRRTKERDGSGQWVCSNNKCGAVE